VQIDHGVARSEPLHHRHQVQGCKSNPIELISIGVSCRCTVLCKRIERALIEGFACGIVGRQAE